MNMTEIVAGGPWGTSQTSPFFLTNPDTLSTLGAGTLAAADGSRTPSELELKIVGFHAKHFNGVVAQFVKGA